MKEYRILVIEDDKHVLELLKLCLKQEGFWVTTAEDGLTGLKFASENEYDLIILDIMLPGKNGWEVCRQITGGKDSWVPVLMLTAKSHENDRILGLEMGADDYVVKPFSPRELVARVRAILRRTTNATKSPEPSRVIDFNGLRIDNSKHIVSINGKTMPLTPKEFELLYFLAQNRGQVFSREQLLNLIWGYEFTESTRTVDEHIKNLRKKLWEESSLAYIHTVWGVGYKFEVTEDVC
ncbi:MAG: hypothetical protein APF84_18490 [Gracilibacter sp. BRH_c7a]|nr:MAG: hypothetical protein APF84_18490 [Gracilibacter sp. BRH_c7a]